MKKSSKTILWVTVFSIAMGFLETSVVVYLRALYYPGGFDFPLAAMSPQIILTELLREAATVVMLLGIGALTGRQLAEKFAYFMYSFAVWDIFYYVFLKLLLNWPESFLTWDILFLIPVTWVGPVIAPVLVSCMMIAFAILIVKFSDIRAEVKIIAREWLILSFGSLVLITSFTLDYFRFIGKTYSFFQMWNVPGNDLMELSLKYIPGRFDWWLFVVAVLIIGWGIVSFYRRYTKPSKGTC